MDIPNTDSVNYAFASAQSQAMQYRHEFITPEHLLSALLEQVPFQKALAECFCTPEELSQSISEYLSKKVERVPQEIEYELEISGQLSELLQYAYMTISHSSAEEMDVTPEGCHPSVSWSRRVKPVGTPFIVPPCACASSMAFIALSKTRLALWISRLMCPSETLKISASA